MKNKKMNSALSRLLLFSFFLSIMAGCSDDPEATHEKEVITTVIVTLTPAEGDAVVTLGWDDVNLDAVADASEVMTSGSLLADETYGASIQILNKSADPQIDITEEIEQEAGEHIFCFTVTGVNISITNRDEDKNGLPVGLTSTWSTASSGTGTVNITLRHQAGVKTGDCPGAGDTDADITFAVSVAPPEE
jgi:hypothetical protein